jgi:hypothetical protein
MQKISLVHNTVQVGGNQDSQTSITYCTTCQASYGIGHSQAGRPSITVCNNRLAQSDCANLIRLGCGIGKS